MRMQRINGRIVIECQHCRGTTECQHALHFKGEFPTYRGIEHWLACQRCGEGYRTLEEPEKSAPLDASALHRPICAVCEGRGFIVA